MTNQKQELIESIESLPEELTSKVIDYMQYIKFTYIINKAPDNLIIKDKKDLIEKLGKGIEDVNSGKVCSIEEVYKEVEDSLNN